VGFWALTLGFCAFVPDNIATHSCLQGLITWLTQKTCKTCEKIQGEVAGEKRTAFKNNLRQN
jgi:hypothetical protein